MPELKQLVIKARASPSASQAELQIYARLPSSPPGTHIPLYTLSNRSTWRSSQTQIHFLNPDGTSSEANDATEVLGVPMTSSEGEGGSDAETEPIGEEERQGEQGEETEYHSFATGDTTMTMGEERPTTGAPPTRAGDGDPDARTSTNAPSTRRASGSPTSPSSPPKIKRACSGDKQSPETPRRPSHGGAGADKPRRVQTEGANNNGSTPGGSRIPLLKRSSTMDTQKSTGTVIHKPRPRTASPKYEAAQAEGGGEQKTPPPSYGFAATQGTTGQQGTPSDSGVSTSQPGLAYLEGTPEAAVAGGNTWASVAAETPGFGAPIVENKPAAVFAAKTPERETPPYDVGEDESAEMERNLDPHVLDIGGVLTLKFPEHREFKGDVLVQISAKVPIYQATRGMWQWFELDGLPQANCSARVEFEVEGSDEQQFKAHPASDEVKEGESTISATYDLRSAGQSDRAWYVEWRERVDALPLEYTGKCETSTTLDSDIDGKSTETRILHSVYLYFTEEDDEALPDTEKAIVELHVDGWTPSRGELVKVGDVGHDWEWTEEGTIKVTRPTDQAMDLLQIVFSEKTRSRAPMKLVVPRVYPVVCQGVSSHVTVIQPGLPLEFSLEQGPKGWVRVSRGVDTHVVAKFDSISEDPARTEAVIVQATFLTPAVVSGLAGWLADADGKLACDSVKITVEESKITGEKALKCRFIKFLATVRSDEEQDELLHVVGPAEGDLVFAQVNDTIAGLNVLFKDKTGHGLRVKDLTGGAKAHRIELTWQVPIGVTGKERLELPYVLDRSVKDFQANFDVDKLTRAVFSCKHPFSTREHKLKHSDFDHVTMHYLPPGTKSAVQYTSREPEVKRTVKKWRRWGKALGLLTLLTLGTAAWTGRNALNDIRDGLAKVHHIPEIAHRVEDIAQQNRALGEQLNTLNAAWSESPRIGTDRSMWEHPSDHPIAGENLHVGCPVEEVVASVPEDYEVVREELENIGIHTRGRLEVQDAEKSRFKNAFSGWFNARPTVVVRAPPSY
ncbi:hypothetical protein SAICODRAFT_18844 [Saitoella complicata NRRL Y-17804]|nr:uncharacterized protein SAICODRAFT_18844 [Saitoella complicata NRRL Y-17804]ODQ53345.1 hypothetical protein SAICODRAFT_18844 [Saitoella complicata NRRL Y-17804]